MIRRIGVGAAALMLSCLVPQVAQAQLAGSRSGSSTTRYLGSEETWEEIGQFGTCFARRNREDALALLATRPGSREEVDTYQRVVRPRNTQCRLQVQGARLSVPMVRGIIAEGLYRIGQGVPANLMLPVPAPGSIRNLSDAARCYTASNRDRVRALLADTRPGSRREAEAIDVMIPEFARCVPQGALNTRFETTQLRFRLAEALLRLSAQ